MAAVLVDHQDLGAVVMSAACWVMGIPVARNENLVALVMQIEDLADVVGVHFKPGWWERTHV